MLYDGETFERGGRTFCIKLPRDDTMGEEPWNETDGNGVIRYARGGYGDRPEKKPGERPLYSARNCYWFYDVQATTERAKEERWGLLASDKAALAKRLGREPTQKQIRLEAVERDFKRWRGWLQDEWAYIGVIVTMLDEDGDEMPYEESLWGIESDCDDYIKEVANELADNILAAVREDQKSADTVAARDWEEARPDLYGEAPPHQCLAISH